MSSVNTVIRGELAPFSLMTISTPSSSGWIWPSRNKPAFPWISISFPGQLSKKARDKHKHRAGRQSEGSLLVGGFPLKKGATAGISGANLQMRPLNVPETSITGSGPGLSPPLKGLDQLPRTSAGQPPKAGFPHSSPSVCTRPQRRREAFTTAERLCCSTRRTRCRRPPQTGCPLCHTHYLHTPTCHNARKNSRQPKGKHSSRSHLNYPVPRTPSRHPFQKL